MIRPSTRLDANAETSCRSRFASSSELPAKTRTPRATATSSIARCSADANGFDTSSSTRPMLELRPSIRRRLLAVRLCRYPTRSTAALTRSLSLRVTPGSPLTTRDTVLMLTLAAAATSRMVGRDRFRRVDCLDGVNVVVSRTRHAAPMANRSHLAFSSAPCYTLTTLSFDNVVENAGRRRPAAPTWLKRGNLPGWEESSVLEPAPGHNDPQGPDFSGGRPVVWGRLGGRW